MSKSWAITIAPLALYLISFVYSIVSGTDFTASQMDQLQGLLYMALGIGTIGATKAVLPKLKK